MEKRNTLLAQKLAYCRELLGYSKKDMASAIGVSPSTYSRYEKGLAMPSVKTLYLISTLADMTMDAFVDDDFSLEEFKNLNNETLDQMIIECFYDIVKKNTLPQGNGARIIQ